MTCFVLLALVAPAALFAQAPRLNEVVARQTPTMGSPMGSSQVNPCSEAQLHLRCPDLEMSAPVDLHIDRTSMPGHVLLRATSSINNFGTGPIELRAHRRIGGPWTVEQAIYDRSGRAHLFPTNAHLVYKFVPGYRYDHPSIESYSYWKVKHLAAFQLWSIDNHFHAIRLIRVGPKVDYCLRDLIHTRESARSPVNPVYPECSIRRRLRSDEFGTSVGWSDVYPYEYPQQWIDVTGLRGRFEFVMIVDPRGLFQESNKSNDVSATYLRLPSGRILGRRVGMATP